MATGYTAGVGDGSVTSFRKFAMECARAFGALVEWRDEPSVPIPEALEPSSYHKEALAKAKRDLGRVMALTESECAEQSSEEYESRLGEWQASRIRRTETRTRYEAMLTEARKWLPPTPEHKGLKDFMVQQLTESIRFDCSHDDEDWKPKRAASAKAWRDEQIKRAKKDIEYHAEHYADDVRRASERTEWSRALRTSLANQLEPTTR